MRTALFTTLATAGLLVAAASPVTAQDSKLILFGQGGGISALTDLNEAGSAKLKTGFTVAGGIGYQIHPLVALRGNLSFAQSEAEGSVGALAGEKIDRWFYGADLQLRLPTAAGVVPYVLVGGGAVTIDGPNESLLPSATKAAFKTGVGIKYRKWDSKVGLFLEAGGLMYKHEQSLFDKTQFDLSYTAGLAIHF